MQTLINSWEKQYYTSILRDIILIMTLFVAYKNSRKFKILKYIPLYTFFLLLSSLSNTLYSLRKDLNFNPLFLSGLADYLDYIFTLFEMLIFSHFYYQLANKLIIKKAILIASILFCLFFIYMATIDEDFYQAISASTQSIVYTVEGSILLLICSQYFIDLFKKLPFVDLKNEPHFWLSTGLLFFMTGTLPYSFLENYIAKNYNTVLVASYSIFHVFYILLFLMIIRAYLCKPQKEI